MDPLPESIPPGTRKSAVTRLRESWNTLSETERTRLARCLGFAGLVIIGFCVPLFSLFAYTLGEELHSHVVLIPVISGWLLKLKWPELPRDYRTSAGWASGFLVLAVGALATALALKFNGPALSLNDHLGLLTFSFLCFLTCGAFFFLGRRWVAAAAFPLAFLLFMIPLPDAVTGALEWASQKASAEAVNVYFKLAGLPYIRNGDVFWIPGMPLRVARECSGIRSSWVLLITSLIAAHLFLRSPWRRSLFVFLVIPLGILRNGFRILVLALLCVYVDPDMINSFIHHRGGPIFFVLSLVPLFLILLLLRRGENRKTRKAAAAESRIQSE